MDSRQQIEKELRESFEISYRDRIVTLKNTLDMKYQTLKQTIATSYKKVLQDQILTTMAKDSTTISYLQERVKELFKEIVQNQREVVIQKLGLQYADLKFHYQELQRKFSNHKKEMEASHEKIYRERIHSQSEKTSIHESLRKKQQQIYEIKLKLNQKIGEIKQKDRINKDLENQIKELKEDKIELKLKLEKYEEEIKQIFGVQETKYNLKEVDLQESQKKLTLLQNTMREMERVNQQKIDLLEKKYRKKVGEYKNKIQQYKAKMLELISQGQKNEPNPHHEIKIQQLERKILSLNRQSQKKLNELKTSKQKDKLEMQKKYQIKYKQLQTYYDRLLEEKVQESEKVAYQAAQRIKSQEDEIKKYIHYMEENSTPLDQYNKLAKYCEGLKHHMEQKLSQNQRQISTLTSDNKQLTLLFQQSQKSQQQLKTKNHDLSLQLNEVNGKLKYITQQMNSMKTNEKKLKALLTDSQANVLSKDEENISLRNQIQKIRAENTQYQGTISERESQLLQKSQQVEILEKKINKLSKDVQSLNEELEITQTSLNNHKKAITEKENTISGLTQENSFKIQNLNAQIHKSTLIIDAYSEKIKELTQKYSSLQAEATQNSRQKAQIEANLRKLQLENKYVKECEASYRQQHESYVSDFKRKINEKDNMIEDLQNTINELKKSKAEQTKENEGKYRKLLQCTKKINRIYSNQMDKVSRNLKDIKIYLQSGEKILRNELKIIQSNTMLKIKQELFGIANEKNEELRKMKQLLEFEKNQHLDATKTKSEKLEITFKEKFETEVRNFQAAMCAKDKQIERLQREKKKIIVQKDQLIQTNSLMQKKVKDLQLILQNQKIQSKSKITELIRSFDTEKDKIINQYSIKRDKQEEEMDELLKNMKNIRKQLQNSKVQYQEQKNKWMSEKNELIEKERKVQLEFEKKKIEVENLQTLTKDFKLTLNKIQTQVKDLNEENKVLNNKLAETEFKNQQLSGQLLINKTKAERLQQQNEEIKRQLFQKQTEKLTLEESKRKIEFQLKQIKSTINKSTKSHELRALQQLDIQTKQLSSKVNQLKKVNLLMSQDRTPLRS